MPIILYELPCFLILPAWYGLSSAYYNYTLSKVKYSFPFFSVIIAPVSYTHLTLPTICSV